MSISPNYDLCRRILARHPFSLLFATVSGAHLYGFPSPDSDYDLRGVHLLPPAELLSLDTPRETVESTSVEEGVEIDLVTHDAGKFFRLLLRKNGYVLEQLLSPLVVYSSSAHVELRELAAGCLTKHHAHHYLGFAATQWRLFLKASPPRAKPLLYTYRVLLTGIHLMRTGAVEANLPRLNSEYRLPYVADLIACKTSSDEHATLEAIDLDFHAGEVERLRARLQDEAARSHLPETATSRDALSRLLVTLRLGSQTGASANSAGITAFHINSESPSK